MEWDPRPEHSGSVAFRENSDLFFQYFLAETLKISIRKVEQMSSSRFEWWKAYFQVKRESEEEAHEEAQRETQAHSRAPSVGGRGRERTSTHTWKFDPPEGKSK